MFVATSARRESARDTAAPSAARTSASAGPTRYRTVLAARRAPSAVWPESAATTTAMATMRTANAGRWIRAVPVASAADQRPVRATAGRRMIRAYANAGRTSRPTAPAGRSAPRTTVPSASAERGVARASANAVRKCRTARAASRARTRTDRTGSAVICREPRGTSARASSLRRTTVRAARTASPRPAWLENAGRCLARRAIARVFRRPTTGMATEKTVRCG